MFYYKTRKTISHDSTEYALEELYFITICSFQKVCRFGKITGDSVQLFELGERIVSAIDQINELKHVELITDYIVMPNHLHMIITLDNTRINKTDEDKSVTISDIIRDFKSFTTHEFNLLLKHSYVLTPLWQRGYYEHRVRNEEELKSIVDYIKENPRKWTKDRFFNE